MKVFPTSLFSPNEAEIDIEQNVISGGTAVNGDEDTIATDGGGRLFCNFADSDLDDIENTLAWRAISAFLGDGRPIILPFDDCKFQPTAGMVSTTHSDGTPFSDESEYTQSGASGEVAASAALRATTIQFSGLVLARALLGGEWFSIDHPTMRWRAYRIAEILAQDVDAGTATVSFRPPLREAAEAGAMVDFGDPRCVMKLDGPMRSPTTLGFASGAVRFVEDFSGSYA